MFESFEPGKTEKAKCPKKREEKKNSTLPKTMPQAAGKNTLFIQYFHAYFIANEAQWPLSASKCCEPLMVSIVQSHFTQNGHAITS